MMLRIVFFVFAFLVLGSIALALLLSLLTVLAVLCLVALPLWMMTKPRRRRFGQGALRKNPIERLQALYAEGKIDMFEFERRVARLISIES